MDRLSWELSAQKPRLKMTSTHTGSVFSIKGWELEALHSTGRMFIYSCSLQSAALGETPAGPGGLSICNSIKKTELNPD